MATNKYLAPSIHFLFSIFLAVPFLVFAETPASFIFASAPQSVSQGVSSEQVTVEARDSVDNAVKGNTVCFQIVSSSSTGEFSSNTNWGAEPVRILTLTLATNQYRRNFYYKDSTVGSHTMTVKAALRLDGSTCTSWSPENGNFQWTVSQIISVGGGGTGSAATSTNQTANLSATTTPDEVSSDESASSVQNSGKTSWPVEPQIVSRIVGPVLGIAGADVVFKAEAVGLDKKPISGIRYLWNFGDGATKEGESVMHAYNFPAEYVVILEASSGHYEGASRVRLKIIPADIIIGEVVAGFDGKIELVNEARQELDLSWWRVRSGNRFFTLPKNTKILPAGRLPISAVVMGFAVVDNDAALLYPNGSLAYKYEKAGAVNASVPFVAELLEVEPLVNEIPTVSESAKGISESSVNPRPSVSISSTISAQTASVVLAESLGTADQIDSNVLPDRVWFSPWLYGVGGVIILGLGFALFPKPSEGFAKPKSTVDEYTIVE